MTFYIKQGRRYIPVAEHVAIDAMPKGHHLVTVEPGIKTVKFKIDPDHASLLAAAQSARDAMCHAIQQASRSHPDRPLTRKQRKIMDEFVAAGGFPMVSRKCAADIADAGINALIEAAALAKLEVIAGGEDMK